MPSDVEHVKKTSVFSGNGKFAFTYKDKQLKRTNIDNWEAVSIVVDGEFVDFAVSDDGKYVILCTSSQDTEKQGNLITEKDALLGLNIEAKPWEVPEVGEGQTASVWVPDVLDKLENMQIPETPIGGGRENKIREELFETLTKLKDNTSIIFTTYKEMLADGREEEEEGCRRRFTIFRDNFETHINNSFLQLNLYIQKTDLVVVGFYTEAEEAARAVLRPKKYMLPSTGNIVIRKVNIYKSEGEEGDKLNILCIGQAPEDKTGKLATCTTTVSPDKFIAPTITVHDFDDYETGYRANPIDMSPMFLHDDQPTVLVTYNFNKNQYLRTYKFDKEEQFIQRPSRSGDELQQLDLQLDRESVTALQGFEMDAELVPWSILGFKDGTVRMGDDQLFNKHSMFPLLPEKAGGGKSGGGQTGGAGGRSKDKFQMMSVLDMDTSTQTAIYRRSLGGGIGKDLTNLVENAKNNADQKYESGKDALNDCDYLSKCPLNATGNEFYGFNVFQNYNDLKIAQDEWHKLYYAGRNYRRFFDKTGDSKVYLKFKLKLLNNGFL